MSTDNLMWFDTETAIQSQGVTVDENNKLTTVGTSSVRGTRSFTGKSYCEFVLEKGDLEVFFGLIRESVADMSNYTYSNLSPGDAALIYQLPNPDVVIGTPSALENRINTNTSVNDIFGIAIDTDLGDVWISVNGSWLTHSVTPEETPNPSTGTSPNFSGYPADAWTIFAEVRKPDTEITCRNTYDSLSYEVPQGFTVLGLAKTPDPSGVNLIQYNGQDILDVAYSDSNSVLQNVEMNLGSAPVWGGAPEPTGDKWALEFDGINDYLSMSRFDLSIRDKFLISGKFIFKSSTTLLSSTITPDCVLFTSSINIILRTEGLGTFSIGPFEDGELIDLKIEREIDNSGLVKMSGNEKEAFIDTGLSSFQFNRIGRPSSTIPNEYYNGQLSGEWLFNVIGEPDRIYDFNLSGDSKTGSGQPVVIDTISGENAIGVNMNTDDSNWVELIAP